MRPALAIAAAWLPLIAQASQPQTKPAPPVVIDVTPKPEPKPDTDQQPSWWLRTDIQGARCQEWERARITVRAKLYQFNEFAKPVTQGSTPEAEAARVLVDAANSMLDLPKTCPANGQ